MILRVIWRCLELTLHGCRELVCLPFDLQLYRKGEASIALGKSLASLLERLGPTFVKLAQVLSSRPDVFSPAVTGPLSRLCEHVRPIPRGQIAGLLSAGLGVPPSRIFRDFEWSPIACGSISQVHRAHLRDGQVVAVKIRRPNAVPLIRADLLLLRWLAACFQHSFTLRGIPLLLIINEFGRILQDQLDFRMEASNMRRFRSILGHLPDVVVPRVYDEWSSESVLIMEYMCNFNRIGDLRLSEEKRHQAARSCVNVLYTMAFEHGFVHTDLHPGNLFFRSNGEIVLVDFGMVTEFEGSDLRSFAHFFFGMVTNQGQQCAQVIYDSALSRAPTFDLARFEADMREMISRYASQRAGEFEVSRFACELFQIQRRHGLCGSPKFVSVILAFVVLEGIVKQLYPPLNFMSQARTFIPRVISNMRITGDARPNRDAAFSKTISNHREASIRSV
ncbi:MAG: phosphotransferase [Acidobacteriia bacterium]|nr:phosphotransferase [Terriglobia bacterium]